MAEEKLEKDTSQKKTPVSDTIPYTPNNAYKTGNTDFDGLLKKNKKKEESEKQPAPPAKKQQKPTYKKDDKFSSLLKQAINNNDEDEEDAFEESGSKETKVEKAKPAVPVQTQKPAQAAKPVSTEKSAPPKETIEPAAPAPEKEQAPVEKKLDEKKPEIIEQSNPVVQQNEPANEPKATVVEKEPEEKDSVAQFLQDSSKEKPKQTPEKPPVNKENNPAAEEVSQKPLEAHTGPKEEQPIEKPEEAVKVPEKATEEPKEAHEKIEEPVKKEEAPQDDTAPMELEDLLKSLEPTKNTVGQKKMAVEVFAEDGETLFEGGKKIKKRFNPNPPAKLIEGKDFNDASLDDIYGYTYKDNIAELRLRKAEQRAEKIEALKAEEERLEQLKKSKKKKKDKPEKQYEQKPKKPVKVPEKYPKHYDDPTDMEIDERTGKPYYYFNFTKTLANSKLKFLSKILPTEAIDDVLYDKGFLDGVADRQHDKTLRLNNMSPEEQYTRDMRNMAISIAACIVFVFSIFWKVTFNIIPDNKYEQACQTMASQDYENAYYQFTELGNKDKSVYFAKYSEAKMYYKTNKFQEAKEAFTLLLPFEADIFKPMGINISDEVSECSYQIALNYYYEGDFETAKNIFKEIYTYSDSTERYYECGYKIAKVAYEDYKDNDDLKKALKYFYRVRKYSSDDVTSYVKTIQDMLYDSADNAYKGKDYETALDLFSYLALFNYTNENDGINSKEMVFQCTYRYGLDLYKNRQYESARKVLSEIPDYKDSYVLSKECIYNIAHILYENNPVGSIAEYNKIVGYRDSSEILYSPRLILYGQWEITEMNGSAITPVDFSFYDDGQFKTNKQILSVAISTAATPIEYEWNGSSFVAMDGDYTITPEYNWDDKKMLITCKGPNNENTYSCKRILSYEELVLAESGETKTETAEETMNQKFRNLIQDYVDKKTDNMVYMDGEDFNIFENVD